MAGGMGGMGGCRGPPAGVGRISGNPSSPSETRPDREVARATPTSPRVWPSPGRCPARRTVPPWRPGAGCRPQGQGVGPLAQQLPQLRGMAAAADKKLSKEQEVLDARAVGRSFRTAGEPRARVQGVAGPGHRRGRAARPVGCQNAPARDLPAQAPVAPPAVAFSPDGQRIAEVAPEPPANGEAFEKIEREPVRAHAQGAEVDLRDRRRHRQLRQRPAVPVPDEPASPAGRGPDRGDAQLLPVPGSAPAAEQSRPVRHPPRGRPLPLERRAPAGPDRHRRQARPSQGAAAEQPRLPDRRLRLDGRRQQAAAGQVVAREARRAARRAGTRWRSWSMPSASGVFLPSTSCQQQDRDPPADRAAEGRGLDQRRRGASRSPTTSRPRTSSRTASTG